jgi:hypothetical protein
MDLILAAPSMCRAFQPTCWIGGHVGIPRRRKVFNAQMVVVSINQFIKTPKKNKATPSSIEKPNGFILSFHSGINICSSSRAQTFNRNRNKPKRK